MMGRNSIAPADTCNGCGWSCGTSKQWLTPRASLADLQESAQHGCPRCRLLIDAVACFQDCWQGTDKTRVVVRCHQQGPGVGVRILWPVEPRKSNRRDAQQIGIEIFSETRPDLPWLHFSHRQIPASAEDGSLEFLRDMIQNCVLHHQACKSSDPGTRSPTRLLRIVAATDPMQEQRVYLTTTCTAENYLYTALSHCWGSPEEANKMPKTTRANLVRQQREGIPVSYLTRTFQDAINLTAQLGLQYIWIDSLCIIQGDAADWATESVTMASVYGGAHLVIAATCGKDGNDGLYPPRNPLQHINLNVGEHEPSKGSSVSVRLSIKSFRPGDCNHQAWQFGTWTPSSDFELPLHKRAWTFQERLLAKRIVHFSPLEMIWECWTESSCECGELQNEANRRVYPGAKSKHREAILDNCGVEERLKAWDGVIAGYSVRDITYYQDRVQAIAGIALQFDMDKGSVGTGLGRYLCGTWEADLPMGLLWYSLLINSRESRKNNNNRDPHHRRLRGWTVPTWSWLSVQGGGGGGVSPADREGIETPLASIVDVSYQVSSENPYGAPVDIPTLTVRGMTVHVEILQDEAGDDPEYSVKHASVEESSHLESDVSVLDVLDEPQQERGVKALRMTTREESDSLNCLIVYQVDGGANNRSQYERLGLASIADEIFEKFGREEDVVLA